MKTGKTSHTDQRSLLPYLAGMALFVAALLFYYGLSRHYNYMTSLVDLGHKDQSIWGTLNGKWFLNTDLFNAAAIGRIEPVLLLFIPFYQFAPSVVWLILAQAIAVPATCLPIYLLARRVCQSEQAAFFWGAACLLSPFMLNAASWDFHPVALAAPLVAMAFLAVEKKQPWVLFISCLLILMTKEHFGLLVAGFGLLWYLKHAELKTSAWLAALGCLYFYLMMEIVVPRISPTGQHLMISNGLGRPSRYGWLGGSVGEVALNIATHPVETLRQALIAMDGWIYLAFLLIPLLLLPMLGGEFLLPGIADLLANLLAMSDMPKSIYSYHSVTLLPAFIVAAIYGSRRLRKFVKVELQACAALIFTVMASYCFFAFVALPGGQSFWAPVHIIAFDDKNYDDVIALIKPNMRVSAQANVGAHFTQRPEIYLYPNKANDVDAVILHLDSPTLNVAGNNPRRMASLAHHLQMDPNGYLRSIKELVRSGNYPGMVWKDPWLILLKEPRGTADIPAIMARIEYLEKTWN